MKTTINIFLSILLFVNLFNAFSQTTSIANHYLGADAGFTQSTDASLSAGFYYAEACAFKYNIESTVYDSPAHAFASGVVSETGRLEFAIYLQTQEWGLRNVFDQPSPAPVPDLSDPDIQRENYARHYKWFYERHGHAPACVAYQGGGAAPSTTGMLFNYMLAGRTSAMSAYNNDPAVWTDINASGATKYHPVSTRFGDDSGAYPIDDAISVFDNAIDADGWYRDFCHWHSNPIYDNDSKLYNYYKKARETIDSYTNKRIVTLGSGTHAQQAWYRSIATSSIVDNGSSLTLSVNYTVPDWMNESWTFDGFTSKPVETFIIPASIKVNTTGSSLAGNDITVSGAISIRKLATNEFLIEVPFNKISEVIDITISETDTPNYVNENLPVINTISNSGSNWIITTDQPTKLVLFRLPLGTLLSEIEAKTSASKVLVPERINVLNSNHSLTISDYTSYDYYIGVITEAKQSILEKLEETSSEPCIATIPINLTTSSITSNSATATWDIIADATYDVRYKETSSAVWITSSVVTTTTVFTGLTANTNYEVQVRSNCTDGTNSSYSSSVLFTTLEGCIATMPTNLTISSITSNSATATWDIIADATYDVRYKETSSAVWITSSVVTTTTVFTGLTANTNYEVQVRSNCTDGTSSSYSSSVTFTTLEESTYCNSQGLDFSEEYISMVRFNGTPNTSGASGYSDFTNFTFEATRGETNLGVIVTTFTGDAKSEAYAVWIDYNDDGIFDDSQGSVERIYRKSPTTSTANYISFAVSETVSLGVKNMRVSMKYNALPTPCETFSHGEVEDYTIEIIDSCDNDAEAPVPNTTDLPTITAECEVTSLPTPIATDNCIGLVNGTHNASFPIIASTTVTWTYTDGTNTSTQTQSVVVSTIDNAIGETEYTLSANAEGYIYQWLDCNDDDNPIIGAIDQTYIATENGSYAVEINNGECFVTSDCITISGIGILENDLKSNVRVYPNPNNGVFSITLNSDSTNDISVTIHSLLGQQVYNKSYANMQSVFYKEISLDNIQSGVYLLQISNGIDSNIKRMIIN